MKFVALVSGGKDSIYSILECQRWGHELVACVHLGRPSSNHNNTEESYMYQSAASEALPVQIQDCLGVPLLLYPRRGTSRNTNLVYDNHNDDDDTNDRDEVEDLYEALLQARERFDGVQAVSSGAVLSTYQRTRVEHVCSRLGWTSLAPLWRWGPTQGDLLQRMIEEGVVAILVKVAAPPGLVPHKHLRLQTLSDLQSHFQTLHDRYQFHVCGEGGEYETLVLDCPLFRRRLVLDETRIVCEDDGTGWLEIVRCHAEEKEENTVSTLDAVTEANEVGKVSTATATTTNSATTSATTIFLSDDPSPSSQHTTIHSIPHVRRLEGGLWHVSGIQSPSPSTLPDESEAAVQEALEIFGILRRTLPIYGSTPQDVVMVHLYLSDMALFASINQHYRDFFGTHLPPSRSCVQVRLGDRRVLLDALVQDTHRDTPRQVLHVQSRSYWAPVCVGPYSQVNTIRRSVHWLAGQIGLDPSTMTLVVPDRDWSAQLKQTWINVARVLDALQSTLAHLLGGLIYVDCVSETLVDEIRSITAAKIACNGSVEAGLMDGLVTANDGYEDEETRLALMGDDPIAVDPCPFLVVAIPAMPVGASVEVEVIAASGTMASCMDLRNESWDFAVSEVVRPPMESKWLWDTGRDVRLDPVESPSLDVSTSIRSIGAGCMAIATTTAVFADSNVMEPVICDLELVFAKMLDSLTRSVQGSVAGLGVDDVFQIRLYHLPSVPGDGHDLRLAFSSAIASIWTAKARRPATTVVPVDRIDYFCGTKVKKQITFAFQAIVLDVVHAETELWIRHGRG